MITQQELKELLHYNPDTGIFTRKKSNNKSGTLTYSGYIRILIKNKPYYAHRLAWLYIYGYFPKMIDHIDNDRANNSLHNLREVTDTENSCNLRIRKDNKSGIKGVSWFKRDKNWRARIQLNKKNIHLGYFDDINDAKNAIIEARIKIHGEFANHG